METYTFEDVAGDRDVFFSEYFDNRPMLRKGALTGRLDDLLSVRGLDDLLALETVIPAYLRIAKDGKGVSPKAYTRTMSQFGAPLVETVAAERVYELFRSGGTVTWNSLNQVVPSVRRLTDAFAAELAGSAEAVAFLTPAHNDGYAPHHDPVDVFVIQLEGTKSWKIWDPPAVRSAKEATYEMEQLGTPRIEVVLRPGDVLYMPYGTPHAAAALDTMSLHVSVIAKPRSWRDVVLETVRELVDDDDFGGFPRPGDNPGAAVAEQLTGRLRLLADRLTQVDLVSEVNRLRATRPGPTASSGEFTRLSGMDALGPDTRLRRSAAPVRIEIPDQGRAGLLVNGHRLTVPEVIATMLRTLEDGGTVSAADFFPGVARERSVGAAQGLARLGVLEVIPEPTR